MNWHIKCSKQYDDFTGRSRRTEYWMFTLFNTVFILLFGISSYIYSVF